MEREEEEEEEEEAIERERALRGMLSGLAALQGLVFLRTMCTWPDEKVGGGKGDRGVPLCVCVCVCASSLCKRC